MRLIYVAIIGGCLFGLIAGCSGGSGDVEIPENPAPLPKNPPVASPKAVDSKGTADSKKLTLPPGGPGQAQPKK